MDSRQEARGVVMKRALIHGVFALPIVLYAVARLGAPSDAGTPYLAMLRTGVRAVAVQQEIHFANNDRFAENVQVLIDDGWEGFSPTVAGDGTYQLVTAVDSATATVAIQGRYTGVPEVVCYVVLGEGKVGRLPPPGWRDPASSDIQCTPGAFPEVSVGAGEGALAYLTLGSIWLMGLVSLLLVLAQAVGEVAVRVDGSKAGATRFLRALGPARVWSVLWVLGYIVLATVLA